MQARVERGSALVHVDRTNDAELRAAVEAAEAEGEWVLVTRGLNNLFEAIPVFTPEGRVVVDRFRRAAGRAGFDSMSHAISAFREAEIASADGDLAATRRAMERGAEWCLRCQQDAEWLIPLEFDLAFEEGRAADARDRARTAGAVRRARSRQLVGADRAGAGVAGVGPGRGPAGGPIATSPPRSPTTSSS